MVGSNRLNFTFDIRKKKLYIVSVWFIILQAFK